MSNYTRFYCSKCNEKSGRTWNHGEDTVKAIVDNLPKLYEAMDLIQSLGYYVSLLFEHADAATTTARRSLKCC